MAEQNSEEDKTEEASAQKLEEARKKGDVAKSADLAQAMSLIGTCAVLAVFGPAAVESLGTILLPFLSRPQTMLGAIESGNTQWAGHLFLQIAPILILFLSGALVLGIGGNLLQTGLLLVPSKLKPDASRVNPMSGFNRLFGVDALVNFVKTFIKLVVTLFIVYVAAKPFAPELIQLSTLSPLMILPFSVKVLIAIAMGVCIFLGLGGGIDYLWQRFRFMQKMRMSKQEQKEEFKQSEGDPHIKAKLKYMREEKSRRRMMSNLLKATVVITNPTHYAVALAYSEDEHDAPLCVAKGLDDVALRIREVARKHDIVIVEDPPLARALYASIDLDETIRPEHFAAVSKIIGFVMTRKRRGY